MWWIIFYYSIINLCIDEHNFYVIKTFSGVKDYCQETLCHRNVMSKENRLIDWNGNYVRLPHQVLEAYKHHPMQCYMPLLYHNMHLRHYFLIPSIPRVCHRYLRHACVCRRYLQHTHVCHRYLRHTQYAFIHKNAANICGIYKYDSCIFHVWLVYLSCMTRVSSSENWRNKKVMSYF